MKPVLISLFSLMVLFGDLTLQPLDGIGAEIKVAAEAGCVGRFVPGAELFSDRSYTLADCPDYLNGQFFLYESIESSEFDVVGSGVLTVLTPESDTYASSQVSALEQQGFTRISEPALFQLFGSDSANQVRVYQKNVQAGEHYSFGKWTVVLGFSAVQVLPSSGVGAEVEVPNGTGTNCVGQLSVGNPVFTDRSYTVTDCPDFLEGDLFLYGSINYSAVSVTKDGVLTVLTAESDLYASSQVDALEEQGFIRIAEPALFQLFGINPADKVCTYQKIVQAGEYYAFNKWTVIVGFSALRESPAWSENDGEILYNGIQLPKVWPPRTIDPSDNSPMPVPYLEYPPQTISIDVGRQLFVDDFLVGQTDLTRTFHLPEKYSGNPVLWPDTPWERGEVEPEGYTKAYGHGNAGAGPKSGGCWWDPDEQVFKLWYETSWFGPVAMATSTNGLDWERPVFDVYPDSNIVTPTDVHPDSWTVVRNWAATDPSEKWTFYVQSPGMGELSGLSFVSSDGIHWTDRTVTGNTGDRSTHFYNPFRKKWVYSLRTAFAGRGRARNYYECDDFLAGAGWTDNSKAIWSMTDDLDLPDPSIGDAPQLYNLDAVAYESLMLGVYEIHRGPANDVCQEQGTPKITELNFAYSRDGFHWDRPDRRAHIAAERTDVWDRGYIQPLGNICTIVGDKLYFYYIGFRGNTANAGELNSMYDNSATGVAMLRRDGFASMDAGAQPGTLTTPPVTFSGKYLFVNFDAPSGALRVEVQDVTGNPVGPFTLANCVPLSTDSTLKQITWTGGSDLSSLAGQPVKLHFELTNGSLYSFWVSKDESGRSDGYVAGGGPGYTGPTDTVGLSKTYR